MAALGNLVLVFIAGLITALATGLGAIPFFLFDDISTRWNVALWGLASGIMVSASVFGLVMEGLAVVVGGLTLPVLAVFMTVAISIHNVPEGVAISIPLRSMDVGEWRMVWWAVFSSLPQPVGATVAYYFVTLTRQFLPEALDLSSTLPRGGRPELAAGLAVGVFVMVPLAFV